MTLKQAIVVGSFDYVKVVQPDEYAIASKVLQSYLNNLEYIKSNDYFVKNSFLIRSHLIGFNATVNDMGDTDYTCINYDTEELYER